MVFANTVAIILYLYIDFFNVLKYYDHSFVEHDHPKVQININNNSIALVEFLTYLK